MAQEPQVVERMEYVLWFVPPTIMRIADLGDSFFLSRSRSKSEPRSSALFQRVDFVRVVLVSHLHLLTKKERSPLFYGVYELIKSPRNSNSNGDGSNK